MSYQGYGRFIVHRIDGEFQKYELMHSEVTQFGHTVPYRTKHIKAKLGKNLDLIELGKEIEGKTINPNDWLSDYVNDCMPYELENMIDAYDFEVALDGFAEVCGYLMVTDTSSDTPYGYEYDSELSLEEPDFTEFKLEDLKGGGYYNAWTVAEWELGSHDEEAVEKRYQELVIEGYPKTWEDIEKDQEAQEEEYRKMMEPRPVPLDNLPKQSDLDEEEEDDDFDGLISSDFIDGGGA